MSAQETCELSDITAFQAHVVKDTPATAPDTIKAMKDGTDPAMIVVSRKTLGWAGAMLFALFSGGQVASLKLADDGPDPATTVLSGRVDALSAKLDKLGEEIAVRDRDCGKLLAAILLYQLESERYQRDQRGPSAGPRSPELEAAAARLKELANR